MQLLLAGTRLDREILNSIKKSVSKGTTLDRNPKFNKETFLSALVTSFSFYLFFWAEAFSGPFALAHGTGTSFFPFTGLYAISDRST